jgi:hypothetical protein
MKLTKAELQERGKDVKFSRFKPVAEAIRKGALVTALTAAAAFGVACGPDGPTSDGGTGGTGGDGGVVSDGGTHSDGGTGGDSGTADLCATYGEGSPNRLTMTLGQSVRFEDNSTGGLFFFKGLDGDEAKFGIANPPQTIPLGYWGLVVGDTRRVYFDGVGQVDVEPCARTPDNCDITLPGNIVSGDAGCTVTVAASKPFAP